MSTPIQWFPFSHLAFLFPPMNPAEFAALVDSISKHGQQDLIAVWRKQIIDGRHCCLACIKAGVEPQYVHLPDDIDPREYVLDMNLARRDMSASQRAVSASRVLSPSGPGRPRTEDRDDPERPYTQREAAERFRVSRSELNLAIKVMSEDSGAHPAVRRGVEQGRITLNDARSVMGEPQEMQREAMVRVIRRKKGTAANEVRRVKREIARREDAAALEAALARPIGEEVTLHHSAVADLHRLVAPETVDAIITHPPAVDEGSLALFSDLAAFAAHALRPGGVLAVVASSPSLPRFLDGLKHPELRWVLEMDLQFSKPQGRSGRPHFISLRRRPLLVYGRPGYTLNGGDDVISVPPPGELAEGQERWHPVEVGMSMMVERFTRPGDVVCDPFLLGWRGTALGARRHGRIFIGADRDRGCVDRTRRFLSEADHVTVTTAPGSRAAPPRNPPLGPAHPPIARVSG